MKNFNSMKLIIIDHNTSHAIRIYRFQNYFFATSVHSEIHFKIPKTAFWRGKLHILFNDICLTLGSIKTYIFFLWQLVYPSHYGGYLYPWPFKSVKMLTDVIRFFYFNFILIFFIFFFRNEVCSDTSVLAECGRLFL